MCLQFINALLSQTEDFEYRMHLRNEIVRCGLFDKFGKFVYDFCRVEAHRRFCRDTQKRDEPPRKEAL